MKKIWKLANFQMSLLWRKIALFAGLLAILDSIALFINASGKLDDLYLASYAGRIRYSGLESIFLVLFLLLCVFIHQTLRKSMNDGSYTMMALPGKINNGIAGYLSGILSTMGSIIVFFSSQILILVLLYKPIMWLAQKNEFSALGMTHYSHQELFHAFFEVEFLQPLLITNWFHLIFTGIGILGISVLVAYQVNDFILWKILHAIITFITIYSFIFADIPSIYPSPKNHFFIIKMEIGISFLQGRETILLYLIAVTIIGTVLGLYNRSKKGK